METIADLRSLHRRALDGATAAVALVRPADLGRPTPCAGWDLRRLLAHMIGQNHGFAAAVESTADGDGDVGLAAFADRQPEDGAFAASAGRVAAAFAATGDDLRVLLPELSPHHRFPIEQVAGFHLLDSLVHAWDVAAALGRRVHHDDDLVAAALAQAQRIPDGERRQAPGAPFAPAVAVDTTGDWERTLALLGRDPAWTAG